MSIPPNRDDDRNRGSFSIRLESAGSRWAFTLFVLLAGAGFCWEAARVGMAAEYAASAKPELWRRAAGWEPDNAAYWAQLGSLEAWDFEGGSLERAAADYEKAVVANPCSDHDWMELADIYERDGQIWRTRSAYEKARTCHPLSAQVAWRHGSFLLRQDEYRAANAEIRRALLADPPMTGAGVLQCWKAGQEPAVILDRVVPGQKKHLLLAMNLFLSEKQMDAALAAWERVVATAEPVEMSASIPLLDDLIREARITEAKCVWREALRAASWRQQGDEANSLVFDGGFEQKFVNGGFGWRVFPIEGASMERDHEVRHSGESSLRVTFDGRRNLDFRNVVEYVPAEPLSTYQVSTFLRTQDISTESGVGFEVFDFPNASALDLTTESLTGTHGWTQVRAEFKTGRATKLLAIALRRTPSKKIDNKLGGTVWVDDVQLIDENALVRHEKP